MNIWDRTIKIFEILILLAILFILLDRPYDTAGYTLRMVEPTTFEIKSAYMTVYKLNENAKWRLETDEVTSEDVIKEIFKPEE